MESLLNVIFEHCLPIIVIPAVIFALWVAFNKGKQEEREFQEYEKKIRTKQIRFLKTSCPLSKKNKAHPRVLELLSGKARISEITVTRFTLWNAGIEPVMREDMDFENEIRIVKAENVTILGVESIHTKNVPSLEFLFKPAENISIGFQSMDANCGTVIQVIHLGDSNGVQLTGKLKGNGIFKQAQSLDNAPSFLREFADIAHIK